MEVEKAKGAGGEEGELLQVVIVVITNMMMMRLMMEGMQLSKHSLKLKDSGLPLHRHLKAVKEELCLVSFQVCVRDRVPICCPRITSQSLVISNNNACLHRIHI